MTENEGVDESEIKRYLIISVEKYISPAPMRAIGVSVRELVYCTHNTEKLNREEKEFLLNSLRKDLNDDLLSHLLEDLVSEGKIKKNVNGKEALFYINDR